MERRTPGQRPMFRLWITTFTDWRPTRWNQVPPRAIAIEPVEDTLYSADEAALFVQGFNQSVLVDERNIWAVAVPITVRYEGDVTVGMPVRGHAFADEPTERAVAPTAARPTPIEIDGRRP